MQAENKIQMYYAPHNEYINTEAKVIIVGITPGFTQMSIAYEQLVRGLSQNNPLNGSLYQAKKAAGFAGSMRTNLIQMLHQCGIPQALQLNDTRELFDNRRDLLHTTSIIKYPVFVHGKNYTGSQPKIQRSELLKKYAFTVFPMELAQITSPSLIVPLGKTVDQVINHLRVTNRLDKHYILSGFPHPSGANGHRTSQFQAQKSQLQSSVKAWVKQLHSY